MLQCAASREPEGLVLSASANDRFRAAIEPCARARRCVRYGAHFACGLVFLAKRIFVCHQRAVRGIRTGVMRTIAWRPAISLRAPPGVLWFVYMRFGTVLLCFFFLGYVGGAICSTFSCILPSGVRGFLVLSILLKYRARYFLAQRYRTDVVYSILEVHCEPCLARQVCIRTVPAGTPFVKLVNLSGYAYT